MTVANKPRGKTATHHRLIKRLFNGRPYEDAKKELVINLIRADIKAGKRGDFQNCAFAKYCQRVFGSHHVAFFRGYAYVEKDRKVQRFSLPQATRDSVMMFDKAGKAEPGGYLLRPPAPSQSLDGRVERDRRRKRGVWPSGPKRRAKTTDADFRSGTGVVQFLKAAKPRAKMGK